METVRKKAAACLPSAFCRLEGRRGRAGGTSLFRALEAGERERGAAAWRLAQRPRL